MTWRGRTFLLSSSLLVVLVAVAWLLAVAARRSPVIPRGAATEQDLLRAIREVEQRSIRLEAKSRELEIEYEELKRQIIESFCRNYPELRDSEVCREYQASGEDQRQR